MSLSCFPRIQLLLLDTWWAGFSSAWAAPVVLDPELQIRKLMNTGVDSFRIARNPDDKFLYYLKLNGALYRVNLSSQSNGTTSTLVYSSSDHQVTSAAGLAIGPDGTIYLTSNTVQTNHTIGVVTKGVLNHSTQARTCYILNWRLSAPIIRSRRLASSAVSRTRSIPRSSTTSIAQRIEQCRPAHPFDLRMGKSCR